MSGAERPTPDIALVTANRYETGMYPSAEFLKMSERFFQDLDLVATSEGELAKFVLGNLTDTEKKRLREFLSEIISDRHSDEQLESLWAMTSAEVGFPDGLRKVLTIVRDHID